MFEVKKPEIERVPTPAMKEIAYERLQGPPDPIETPPLDMDLWLRDIADSSEFQRLIYLIWKGKVHRGSKVSLKNELELERKDRFGPVLMELKKTLKDHYIK